MLLHHHVRHAHKMSASEAADDDGACIQRSHLTVTSCCLPRAKAPPSVATQALHTLG